MAGAMVDAPDAKRLPIIVCGSSQGMMQGLVLDSDAPLCGRAQLILRLEPMPPAGIRTALGLPNAIALVELYAAFGGVPRYWELMRERRCATAEEAPERLVFSPQGVLHDEAGRAVCELSIGERAVLRNWRAV